jgi:hypothetical protein
VAGESGRRLGWALFAALGIGAWMGATVFVSVTNDNPSDSGPVGRTFAIGGAIFFAALVAGTLLDRRRYTKPVDESLYRKLALSRAPAGATRDAMRHTIRVSNVYLLFGGLMTALVLGAIGLGEDGPQAVLMYGALGVAGVLGVYMLFAMGTAFRQGGEWLKPLGLAVTEIPSYAPRPSGGGMMIGRLAYRGRRHGRKVEIAQTSNSALTRIEGSFCAQTIDDPDRIAALAGEPGPWRRVRVEAGPGGVTVERRGNGAGRYLLQDLWLAERVAGRG